MMEDPVKIAYSICTPDNAPCVPFRFDGRILFTSPRYELVHLTLQPGEGMEPHVQPMDVVFFVVEGSGSLTIGEELLEINANTTVHVKAGISRAWTNTGNQPLKILVNKLLLENRQWMKGH
jgi:mannose-6-phosphate isomerase-like protein (cupin superfamily)